MKNLIKTLFLLLFFNAAYADVGLHFDQHGKLIHPDDFLLERGINAAKKGFNKEALKNYIKSAKFGNNRALYLTGMYYLTNKDWPNAYAWLRLMGNSINNSDVLTKQIKSLITQEELNSSNKIYSSLKPQFSAIAALNRREKWDKSIKLTGSHIGGIRAISGLKILTGNTGLQVSSYSLFMDVQRFKYEYEEIETEVIMGEIIPVNN